MSTKVAFDSRSEEFVRKLLEAERFSCVSEVVHAGLRLLEDAETLREIRHRELKAVIEEGIESEDAGSIEDVIARNRARRAGRKVSKKYWVRVGRVSQRGSRTSRSPAHRNNRRHPIR